MSTMRHDVEIFPDMEDNTYRIRLKDTSGTLNTTNGRHITFKEDPQLPLNKWHVCKWHVWMCSHLTKNHFFHMWLTLYNKPAQIWCVMPSLRGPSICVVPIIVIKGDEIGLRRPWNDRLCFFLRNTSILCYFGYITPLQTLWQSKCLVAWPKTAVILLQMTVFVLTQWLCLHGQLYFDINWVTILNKTFVFKLNFQIISTDRLLKQLILFFPRKPLLHGTNIRSVSSRPYPHIWHQAQGTAFNNSHN